MKCLLASALVLAVAASAVQIGAPKADTSDFPKAWISLFQPPYTNAPEIMINIGCTSDNVCYVPGGSNGVGFGIYRFDGQENGNFVPVRETDKIPFDFTLFLGVAGTSTAPKGAVGGLSLWDGLKYFVNSTTVAPANIPISEEQYIAVDKTGESVFIINGFTENYPQQGLVSADGGKTYSAVSIAGNPLNKTCTQPLAQAIASSTNWVVAAGSFPEDNNGGNGGNGNIKIVSDRIAIVKPGTTDAEIRAAGFERSKHNPLIAKRSLRKLFKERAAKIAAGEEIVGRRRHRNDGPKCPYTAAVFYTMDAGKTWATKDFNTSYWSPSGIACSDATTCYMVGSGMGQFPGSRVMKTTDAGASWTDVLFLPSEGGEQIWAMNAIAVNPMNPNEVWVGGGVESAAGNSAVFFYSTDAGSKWTRSNEVNFVEEVTDFSFTQEGNAFAVGITQFDDSTILRYTADGFPQTPVPVYNGNFTQVQCDDNACSVNCTTLSLPQHTCLKLNGQGPFGQPPSAIATCDLEDKVLIQDIFILDDKCTGPAEPQPQALNLCFELQGGGSFKNLCGPNDLSMKPAPEGASFKVQNMPKKHKL